MNTLEYIDGVLKMTINYCQEHSEMTPADCQSILLSLSDKIRKELNNNFLKVCMDILEKNPHLANRQCCGNYVLPHDKVEIKFNKFVETNLTRQR